MTQTCPRCLQENSDGIKFCTSCGSALIPASGDPATGAGTTPSSSAIPSAGTIPPAGSAEKRPDKKVIIMAVIAVIAITAILVFFQASGTFRIFPSATPAVTPNATQTPTVTSTVVIETPSPDITTVPPELPPVTTVPGTSRTTAAPPKALVCPSDRRACGMNCTDILTDPDNCGDCGVSCYSGYICQMGSCMPECGSDEVSCYDGCHNISYDSQNCGTCGNTCPVGLVCNKSICSPPLKTAVPTYLG